MQDGPPFAERVETARDVEFTERAEVQGRDSSDSGDRPNVRASVPRGFTSAWTRRHSAMTDAAATVPNVDEGAAGESSGTCGGSSDVIGASLERFVPPARLLKCERKAPPHRSISRAGLAGSCGRATFTRLGRSVSRPGIGHLRAVSETLG